MKISPLSNPHRATKEDVLEQIVRFSFSDQYINTKGLAEFLPGSNEIEKVRNLTDFYATSDQQD